MTIMSHYNSRFLLYGVSWMQHKSEVRSWPRAVCHYAHLQWSAATLIGHLLQAAICEPASFVIGFRTVIGTHRRCQILTLNCDYSDITRLGLLSLRFAYNRQLKYAQAFALFLWLRNVARQFISERVHTQCRIIGGVHTLQSRWALASLKTSGVCVRGVAHMRPRRRRV